MAKKEEDVVVTILNQLEEHISSSSSFRMSLRSHLQENSVKKLCDEFEKANSDLEEEIWLKLCDLANKPLIILFFSWIRGFSDPDFYQGIDEYLYLLIKEKFVVFRDDKGKLLTADELRIIDSKINIVEDIRSRRNIPLKVREKLISAYIDFREWLEWATLEHVCFSGDPDRKKTKERMISFDIFLKFLEQLDDKHQLIAKLLYFGGIRTLDEVLSLNLENIEFQKGFVRYDSESILYPKHVFEDIKALTKGKSKKERLFKGRQNANLNPATVFRHFKEAGSKIGLGTSFSPKNLTTSIRYFP